MSIKDIARKGQSLQVVLLKRQRMARPEGRGTQNLSNSVKYPEEAGSRHNPSLDFYPI
jgi:hypothetical protein